MQSSMVNPNPMEKSMDLVVVVENAGGGSLLLYGVIEEIDKLMKLIKEVLSMCYSISLL
jgi:hypothetical protein